MKIRSVTVFLHPGSPLNQARMAQAGQFVQSARQAYTAAGYEVQTVRLATVPFPGLVEASDPEKLVLLAKQIESAAVAAGFEYISIGPALPGRVRDYYLIPDVFAATNSVFLSGSMTNDDGSISLEAVRGCAQVIHRAARLLPDGFANLRFAALANVPPGSPFFPAAYHQGEEPSFALALEAAALAVNAFSIAQTLEDACLQLQQHVEAHAQRLSSIGRSLQAQFGFIDKGLDFSLAPFPERSASLGTALEALGVPAVGLHGSLAAAAMTASVLDQARFGRVGFNGLFLPVLEDAVLARRAAEGALTVKDLLLYSAVCGAGIDTVPLPGDTSEEALQAVLLDVAALALRLDKPLTARLMPIPGKKAGDPTNFDFSFFANSRVMALEAQPLQGLLAGGRRLQINSRR